MTNVVVERGHVFCAWEDGVSLAGFWKLIAETAKLPEEAQEAFAAFMLAELESDRRWDELFARSQDVLARRVSETR